MDVVTAFVNTDVVEKIHTQAPQGLNGLKQGPRIWNDEVKASLKENYKINYLRELSWCLVYMLRNVQTVNELLISIQILKSL